MQRFVFFLVAVLGFSGIVSAQPSEPKIGFAYPAGGRQGTTVEVLLCGKQLMGAREVLVSGSGVQGRVVKTCRMFVTDSDTRTMLRDLYLEAKDRLEAEAGILPKDSKPGAEERKKEKQADAEFKKNGNQILAKPEESKPEEGKPEEGKSEEGKKSKKDDIDYLDPEKLMSQYLYFDRLKNPTLEDIQLIYYEHFAPRPDRKPKETLSVGVIVELTIGAGAAPGDRDLRVLTGGGLSNPVRFQVGTVNEVNELEPNDTELPSKAWLANDEDSDGDPMASLDGVQLDFWGRPGKEGLHKIYQLSVLDLPVVINGQIRRGDVDRFKFRAKAGEKLVIGVRARHLMPFLADAVPGWFQAAMTLFSPSGKIVRESSSYRTDPDPLIMYEVPKDGEYILEIKDSIFRGRDDFIYRISIGRTPLITSMFPLGGRANQPLAVDLRGWNLPEKVAMLDTQTDSARVRELTSVKGVWLPYPVRYAVDTLPESFEQEPNNDLKSAKSLKLPVIVNGRIEKPGDVDCFRFSGRKGEKAVLDVSARNLGSPLDGVLELFDVSGKLLASNDDRAGSDGPNIGLETHHADPYIMVELPADGEYFVRLYHSGSQSGPEYAYRLRVSAPRPDFAVYVGPSSLSMTKSPTPFQAYAVRTDGFDGEIRLRLTNGYPGLSLGSATIPAGSEKADCELKADSAYWGLPRKLLFSAVAMVDGKEVSHVVTAVDDYEQAFIYHHWVPTDSTTVVRPKFRQP